ncbi:MAG: M48 family metallopeptidase [Oscillospiraceae bacterium]|nr:M48 family metallopeptidase [Oscillospiraceae bacterium]
MNYKSLALAVLTLMYLYNLILSVVHMKSADNPIPENVADVYDRETYAKWRQYHAERSRFGILTTTASFLIDLVLISSNAYAWFAGLFPQGTFMQMAAVMLLSALSSLLLIPFSWHSTMVIEEKYGFNRSSVKTFAADQLKEFLIGLLVMVAVGTLLMWIHLKLGDWLIVLFAGLMTLFALGIAFLYPVLSRVFNRFVPLEEGELREKLTLLLEKNGYQVRDIKVMDASRRTTKSNAYFSGFGKMKTIVLYDTLTETMSADEICAVFAHELGHGLHKDTLKNQILSFVQMLLLATLAWLTLRTEGVFADFGFDGINYGFAVILIISVEFALISPLFGLVINYFSRKAEYRADEQAVKEGYGEQLIGALKKLSRQNFSDLAPSPLLVALEYSHPTLSQRIDAIEKSRESE